MAKQKEILREKILNLESRKKTHTQKKHKDICMTH